MTAAAFTTTGPSPRWSEAMARALHVSLGAQGHSSPNPPVGAVVLDSEGRTVGVGATEPAGGRHAEIVALDAAGPAARGGTAVVTLEPCDHRGRTGPCTARLIAEGIARVVIGTADPNPLAAGGARTLQAAGVDVQWYGREDEVTAGPLRAWLHRQRTGRPMVTWKYAATLDGRVAAADGTSRWITCAASREHAHRRRARVDAIVVGTGTCAADDPSLTARDASGALLGHQPLACVMGLTPVPESAAVRRSPGGFRHLATRDPRRALELLDEAVHVIVEGGPRLAGAFLAAGVVDEIDAYLAPLVLGAGHSAVTDAAVDTLSAAHHLVIEHTEPLGTDLYVRLGHRKG